MTSFGGGPTGPGGLPGGWPYHQGVGAVRDTYEQVPQGPAFEAEYAEKTAREGKGGRSNLIVRLVRSLFRRS